MIKENDFHFFIKISSNDYSAFPAFTPENLIERIKYCISSFKKYEKQIIQLDRYGEILNLDDIEKYIPSLVNLTKNSEQRLKVLISKLQLQTLQTCFLIIFIHLTFSFPFIIN